MMRYVTVSLISVALLCGARAAEKTFTASLSPEELAAAGLTGLSPAQLARLNALVAAYQSGTVAAARRATNETPAPSRMSDARANDAEIKSSPGILGRAKVLLKPGTEVEIEPIESTIAGKFEGWEPHRVFKLANGQRWQVSNDESYFTPAVENPKVKILPASMGGYWLKFPDLGLQVRVNYVGQK